MPAHDPSTASTSIDLQIAALPDPTAAAVRTVRRAWSARMRDWAGVDVLAIAEALLATHRWVAYELIEHHPGARSLLDDATVTRLGRDLCSWGDVDAFGRHLAGIAWQRRQLDDGTVEGWACAPDRWWRRAALVSTVPLNLRAAGGSGDAPRTLRICGLLVADRDPMVVKALSWALRELVRWDPDAVVGFLDRHGVSVAPLVRREVTTKLRTGRKSAARRDPT